MAGFVRCGKFPSSMTKILVGSRQKWISVPSEVNEVSAPIPSAQHVLISSSHDFSDDGLWMPRLAGRVLLTNVTVIVGHR